MNWNELSEETLRLWISMLQMHILEIQKIIEEKKAKTQDDKSN